MSSSKTPYGYVYIITNLINGKTYVGSRKLSLDKSWRQYMGSGRLIKQAIDKYGVKNFVKSFVVYGCSEVELLDLEWAEIQRQQALGKAEYNLFNGRGAGGNTFAKLKTQTLEDVRRKQSEGLKSSEKQAAQIKRRVQKRAAIYQKKFDDVGLEIIEKYQTEHTPIKELSLEYNIPYDRINKFLKENEIPMNLRNAVGHITSSSQKEKVRKALAVEDCYYHNGICKNPACEKPFKRQSSRTVYCSPECRRAYARFPQPQFTSSYEELYDLYVVQGLSVQELMTRFNCSQRTVYNMLKRHSLK